MAVDGAPVLHEEMRPSEANIEKPTADANQASPRQVKPIAHLHKILKFRLLTEEKTDSDGFTGKNWLDQVAIAVLLQPWLIQFHSNA